METDVIEQILAMARHPAYDCYTAKVSVEVVLNLTQCPETHTHIVREEFLESLIEICEQRHKMVSQQSAKTLQGKKEDPMVIKALKYAFVFLSPFHIIYIHSCSHTHTHARTDTRY